MFPYYFYSIKTTPIIENDGLKNKYNDLNLIN